MRLDVSRAKSFKDDNDFFVYIAENSVISLFSIPPVRNAGAKSLTIAESCIDAGLLPLILSITAGAAAVQADDQCNTIRYIKPFDAARMSESVWSSGCGHATTLTFGLTNASTMRPATAGRLQTNATDIAGTYVCANPAELRLSLIVLPAQIPDGSRESSH